MTVPPPPASEETGMPALPLDAYDPDLDTLTVQAEASRRLTDECLAVAGYDLVPAGSSRSPSSRTSTAS
jgi:hypothetical protein